MNMQSIPAYYDELAPHYDADRFGNTYGAFLDTQERAVLSRWCQGANRLDLACGTGRLLDLADTGCDASAPMLEMARAKHPDKTLVQADARQLPFPDNSFDTVCSMHFLMHLDAASTTAVCREVHRILRPGGRFLTDFPSLSRRNLLKKPNAPSWHGANAMREEDFLQLAGPGWTLQESRGLMWLPIHRFSAALRKSLLPVDNLLCRSPLKKYASYLLVCLQKS